MTRLIACKVERIWHELGACKWAWGAVLEADEAARKQAGGAR